MKAFLAQARAELALTLRRSESVLVAMLVPAGLLLFFSMVPGSAPGGVRRVNVLLPGTISIGVVAMAMVSLGIATGYERHYKVLKRLGATPLGRPRLLLAKALAVLLVEVVEVVILIGIATTMLGWDPHIEPGRLTLALVLGTVAFAGIGLFFAGTLRAEANLAVANGLFLLLILLGGSIVPVEKLPGLLEPLARVLPAAALTGAVRAALEGGPTLFGSLALLAVWAAAAPLAASLTFSWD
jgi:ABC-2 type transport system permease protein